MNTKAIGDCGEILAVEHLKRHGYKILERNVVLCGVEVDIIAKHSDIIVFCEVKTRSNTKYGLPVESVTHKKQGRYIVAATAYMVQKRLANTDFRFDVIEVLDGEITHIVGAFDATAQKYFR